jgi:hypothetical protein
MGRGIAWALGIALLVAVPAVAQLPAPNKPAATPNQTLPQGTIVKPCVGANCPPAQKPSTPAASGSPEQKPGAAAVVTPLRKTTSELAFVGRPGEKPPEVVAFSPIRKTTSELAFTGRAGEAPPAVATFTPIRKTTGELAFVGAPK